MYALAKGTPDHGSELRMISAAEICAVFFANTYVPRQVTINYLRSRGVPANALAHDGDGGGYAVGTARVSFVGRYFDFDDAGIYALVVIARDEFGDAADLVAFDKRNIATRLGRCCLLGETEVAEHLRLDPMAVHRTPLEWLCAGRRGVVILHPGRARWLLQDLGLLAHDVDHGVELQHVLSGPVADIRIRNSPKVEA